MLHEFITIYYDAIIGRTREKLSSRGWPTATAHNLEYGVPLFLNQLSETLRRESSATPFSPDAIGASAALHGCELLSAGFNVSEVVHDYGDICQAITELALDHRAAITLEEFHTLNRCLDTAIAEAVTEHARLTSQWRSSKEVERLGQVATEMSSVLNTVVLASLAASGLPAPPAENPGGCVSIHEQERVPPASPPTPLPTVDRLAPPGN